MMIYKLKFTNKLIVLGLLAIIVIHYLHRGIKRSVSSAKAHEVQRLAEFNKIRSYIDKNTKKLRVYVANIESSINDNFISNQTNYGHGEKISYFREQSMINLNTHQYAADFIFYDRIRNDKSIRVRDMKSANVVYVPVMLGSLCNHFFIDSSTPHPNYLYVFHTIGEWFKANEKELQGKSVLLVHSRGENTLTNFCGMIPETAELLNKYVKNLYIANYAECEFYQCKKRFIKYTNVLMPYPTISKYVLKSNKDNYETNLNDIRLVDVFFGGKNRKNHPLREYIFLNIKTTTNRSFHEFKQRVKPNRDQSEPLAVIYSLASYKHRSKGLTQIIDWKLNSKLCLEPYGDTPTRRSFWDSIMLGCIPVIFTDYKLPFEDQIDYNRFVVRLNIKLTVTEIRKFKKQQLSALIKPYLDDELWMENARQYMKKIRQFLQFSWPYNDKKQNIDPTFRYDAYGMLLANLAQAIDL